MYRFSFSWLFKLVWELLIKYVYLELTGDVDAEELNNVEDDEEDDIEVDNGEEALDTYDGHDLVINLLTMFYYLFFLQWLSVGSLLALFYFLFCFKITCELDILHLNCLDGARPFADLYLVNLFVGWGWWNFFAAAFMYPFMVKLPES